MRGQQWGYRQYAAQLNNDLCRRKEREALFETYKRERMNEIDKRAETERIRVNCERQVSSVS